MTTTQIVTTRPDHRPSNDHLHRWRHPYMDGIPEQCRYRMCQATSVTILTKPGGMLPRTGLTDSLISLDFAEVERRSYESFRRGSIRERLIDRLYGPPIYEEAPSDICSFCGGSRPCGAHSLTPRELAREQLTDLSSPPGPYTQEELEYIPESVRQVLREN